jgi:hypothetical protein
MFFSQELPFSAKIKYFLLFIADSIKHELIVSSFVLGGLHMRTFFTAHTPVRGYYYNERRHNSGAACFFTPTRRAVTIVDGNKNGKDALGLVLL